ncbi:MAG: hypothetical protein AM1032_000322 [Mycoplasmataceae bacterium]|nr:MAG: hypothetical protein AM1032_000322 [Mycoplasmataceae bacterium]
MNNKSKEKFIILGEINIQPLINMEKALNGILKDSKNKEGDAYQTYKMAAVQAFEVAYEISWKTMKRVLKKYSIELHYSKDVFRESVKAGLINNPEKWFKFLEKRNETTHSYDSDILEDIFEILPEFNEELNYLISKLKEKI